MAIDILRPSSWDTTASISTPAYAYDGNTTTVATVTNNTTGLSITRNLQGFSAAQHTYTTLTLKIDLMPDVFTEQAGSRVTVQVSTDATNYATIFIGDDSNKMLRQTISYALPVGTNMANVRVKFILLADESFVCNVKDGVLCSFGDCIYPDAPV